MPKTHAAINKKSKNSANPNRPTDGKGGMRSKSTIMRLNMYKGGKAVRNKEGKVVGGSLMMANRAGGKDIGDVARIAPDRRWFGNTRVISQNELDKFRDEMTTQEADPYSVVLRRKKIPITLLQESEKVAKANLLQTESFESAYGNRMTRKRPKISDGIVDCESLLARVSQANQTYNSSSSIDSNLAVSSDGGADARMDDLFSKGQSKRIWAELYKVLDCSDVVIQVVDARNVPGTRCTHIERHLKKNSAHKHLVIVINKCDLVPSWVTKKWVKILSKEYPTLAFHASITNSFGKGALISLLRQFGKLHADKRQISVGVIGYPNTGKSSVINALVGKKCCKSAPVPGETRVWQYITLMRRIFLIDSPGVVHDTETDEVETVLKGVVRSERLDVPTDFIGPILDRVKPEYIQKQYDVKQWTDHIDFLTQLAYITGKLRKGGEPDLDTVAKNIINDWQRGKIPYFVPPPSSTAKDGDDESDDDVESSGIEGFPALADSGTADGFDDHYDDHSEDDSRYSSGEDYAEVNVMKRGDIDGRDLYALTGNVKKGDATKSPEQSEDHAKQPPSKSKTGVKSNVEASKQNSGTKRGRKSHKSVSESSTAEWEEI